MATKRKAKAAKARWEFLWWNDKHYPSDRHMKAKIYTAPTIEKACDKMLRFIQRQPFVVAVDYEAQALHVKRYNPKNHEATYPNLSNLNHPIREYI